MADAKYRQGGFTVVELAIVIVVIAILASIAIVGYVWSTKDARAAKMATTANQYIKALELYKSKNGIYPISGHTNVCLGTYPNVPDSDANTCVSVSSSGMYFYSYGVNSSLSEVGMSPDEHRDVVAAGPYFYRGFNYYSNNGRSYTLNWYLKGDEDCGNNADKSFSSSYDFTHCTKITSS